MSEKDIGSSPIGAITIHPVIIIISALLLGVLSSIPRLRVIHQVEYTLILADFISGTAFVLAMWLIFTLILKKRSIRNSYWKIVVISLIAEIILMMAICWLIIYIFPEYELKFLYFAMQFKGFLINMLLLVTIYSLLQNHKARLYSGQLAEIKAENLQAQFDSLRNQVNPHFLFNSLNILKSMIESHDPMAPDLVMKLSDLYRFTLHYNGQTTIKLEEELRIMNTYIFLLKARFEESLQIQNLLDGPELEAHIPPFTIQLLIENAIKHNVVSLNKPLTVTLLKGKNFIQVTNNLQPKRKSDASTHTGLHNIRQRYRLLGYDQVDITADHQYFTVQLPLIKPISPTN